MRPYRGEWKMDVVMIAVEVAVILFMMFGAVLCFGS